MKRFVCTFVLALTTLVMANFVVAQSKSTSAETGGSVTAAGAIDAGDSAADHQQRVQPDLNPRLEFVQWGPVSWVCVTPTFSCTMAAPYPVGSSCYCPVWGGGIAYGVVR